MRSIIRQTVTLPVRGEQLFDIYLTPESHAAFTGSPVTISDSPGSEFKAFDGQLSGTTLEVVRPTLVVQSWRSVNFGPDDPDSTLVLLFKTVGNDGQIDLIHVDVPPLDFDGVTNGWDHHYWKPWRAYLESQSK